MRIRRAAPQDSDALLELYTRHLTQTPQLPASMESWQSLLEQLCREPSYHLLVGEVEGQVVASVTLVVIPNLTHGMRPYALIENVVTHAESRGRGYGGEMLAEAVRISRQARCYKVMLLTGSKNPSTLGFYEKCGFNCRDKTAFIKWLD